VRRDCIAERRAIRLARPDRRIRIWRPNGDIAIAVERDRDNLR
jgi:hypothetical protein